MPARVLNANVPSRLRWALLAAISSASALIWWTSLVRLTLLTTYYRMPHLDTPKLLGISQDSIISFAATALLETFLWLAAWQLVRPTLGARAAAVMLLLSLPSAAVLLMSYPSGAGDVYAYVAEADLVLRYHLNPFFVPVGSVPDVPLLPFLDFPGETTHYGPLWLAMSVAIRLVSGGDLLTALLLYKTVAVLFLCLISWMVFLTLRDDRPTEAVCAALLIAWNPLMLFETAANAHNDVAMMAFVSLAFYLQRRERRREAIFALIAATLVKYVAVILVPVFLLADLRHADHPRRWLPRVAADAVGLTLFGCGLSLLVGIEGTLGILQRMTTWFTTSPGAVLFYYLSQTIPQPDATRLVGEIVRVAFAVVYVGALAWLWARPAALTSVALAVMLGLMLIETVWFQPWYAAWALPIAVILANPLGTGLAIGMTAGGFGIHAVMGFAWRLWWPAVDKLNVHAGGTAVMWIPVLAGGIFGLALQKVPRGIWAHVGPTRSPAAPPEC